MIDLPVSAAEYPARQAAALTVLESLGVETAVIFSGASHYWLTGLDTFTGANVPLALILSTRPGARPAWVLWDADVAIAQETSVVVEHMSYVFGVDAPEEVVARAVETYAPGTTRLAIDLGANVLSYTFGQALHRALGVKEVVDCTSAIGRLVAVKSPSEMELMRAAGRQANAALETARQYARPGMTEVELVAEMEYVMRRAGGDFLSIPTELTSGPRTRLGHGTPINRKLEAGDPVHVEIGGCVRRYNCVAIETFAVPGATPDPAFVSLYEIAREALSAGIAQLCDGAIPAEVEASAREVIRRAGCGDGFMMRFGYGVGIGYPPSWMEPVQITRGETSPLKAGMTLVMHACLHDPADRFGVLVGGTYAVTTDGYEMLAGAGAVRLEV